jgi:3-dehydroquinate dehydratase type II
MGGDIGADPVGSLDEREKETLEEVIDEITAAVSNVVLTGMPGSGKSTVGAILAEKLGLEYVDTDEIFTEDNGMDPGAFIREYGEKEFRKLEKEAVKKAAAKGGRVIATGGGAVLDPENTEYLSLNGTIIYLHRKLSDLAIDNRPLSEGAENLKALYYKRLPIYLAGCDIKTEIKSSAESVAEEIIYRLHNYNKLDKKDREESKGKAMKLLIVNGPNLNMLGIREPDIYGRETYDDLLRLCRKKAEELNVEVDFYQSNHEGDLVDIIQQAYGTTDGIIINPGAYTHTSVAILDALKAVGIPAIEVHISDVDSREEFRQTSYIRSYVKETITGHGLDGYTMAMEKLVK